MHVLCRYGPMAEFLEGDLGWVLILAIVEPIFYIHGMGEWWKRKAGGNGKQVETESKATIVRHCHRDGPISGTRI